MAIGDEIEKQNRILEELDSAVDETANTITQNRRRLQQHTIKYKNKNCTLYMICVILILLVIIFILNVMKGAFSSPVSNKHEKH